MKRKEDFFVRKTKEAGVLLNDIQAKAVLQTEGPLLLLASPGSGKTTTIVMRIGYLVKEKGIDPARIKAVTFSRASANDMKQRFSRFFPELPPVDFSTIHSFAFEVVRSYFHKQNMSFQLIEGSLSEESTGMQPSEQMPLHKKIILRQLFQSITKENITDDQLDELTTYISFIKNKMISPEKWGEVPCSVPEAERILREYESFKKSGFAKRLLDFDDMLTVANKALEQEPVLLKRYQQRFDYVLTDESQDTSLVQHAILEKLVQNHQNLCVVADDDQSIYSWRGAEPAYLLNFKQIYPQASILFMEQNYRSTPDIVNVANAFIKRNSNRYDKNMFTHNQAGRPIKTRHFSSYLYQAKYVVQEVQKAKNLSEIAVLYRNNSSSIALMNEFDRAGVPFYMKDADNRFFSHWVVEDILNFMRMTFTDKRADILEKIYSKFNGYISKQQAAALKELHNNESVFDNLIHHVGVKEYQVQPLKASKHIFQQMKGMPPREAIRVIRSRLGYEKALEKMCGRLGFKKEVLIGILNTLEEIADTLETMESFAKRLKHLEEMLKTAKLKNGQNAVTFSTLHSSKGLEFERVYIVDAVEGIIPSSDDKNSSALMEEAVRLFYVGMTRAKHQLELISYRERDGEAAAESSFLSAVRDIISPPPQSKENGQKKKEQIRQGASARISLNPNAVQDKSRLLAGKKVKHRVLGTGTIITVDEEKIHIQFTKREKTLLIAACLEMGLLELL